MEAINSGYMHLTTKAYDSRIEAFSGSSGLNPYT